MKRFVVIGVCRFRDPFGTLGFSESKTVLLETDDRKEADAHAANWITEGDSNSKCTATVTESSVTYTRRIEVERTLHCR